MAVFPYVTLANQWTDGEEINAAKMFARVDTQLNALANSSFNPPRFKGSIKTNTSITASTPIKFPSIYDTASAYSVATGQYTVPLAGTYLIQCQLKWNAPPGTAVQLILVNNAANVAISTAGALITEGGPQLAVAEAFALGNVVSVQVDVGYTTLGQSPADNNYWIMTWVGV